MYHPDNWVLIRTPDNPDNGEPVFKVVAGWRGGYASDDTWRVNSGITHVVIEDEPWGEDKEFYIHGHTGSVYHCWDFNYGVSGATAGIIKQLMERGCGVYDEDGAMEVLYALRKEV